MNDDDLIDVLDQTNPLEPGETNPEDMADAAGELEAEFDSAPPILPSFTPAPSTSRAASPVANEDAPDSGNGVSLVTSAASEPLPATLSKVRFICILGGSFANGHDF